MKKIIPLIIPIVLSALSIADAQKNFIRNYGDVENDQGLSIIQTLDGGMLLTGKRIIFNTTSWDVALYKTDASGAVQWKKYFTAPLNDYAFDVMQNADSSYTIAGTTESGPVSFTSSLLMKVASSGTLLWSKIYNNTDQDIFRKITHAADGSYVIAGTTGDQSAPFGGATLTKTDTSGNILWTKSFGGQFSVNFFIKGLTGTSDGGYTIFGFVQGPNIGGGMLLHFNSMGDSVWTKYYQQPSTGIYTTGNSFVYTSNGEYLLNLNNSLVKTDSLGSIQWAKNYLQTGSESRVFQCDDGNFLFAGSFYTVALSNHLYLFKTDTAGNLLWSKKMGDNLSNILNTATLFSNNHIAIGGKWSTSTVGEEMFILVDSLDATSRCLGDTINIPVTPATFTLHSYSWISNNGGSMLPFTFTSGNPGIDGILCLSTGIDNPQTQLPFSFNSHPNPADRTIYIDFNLTSGKEIMFTLYNLYGQKIISIPGTNYAAGNHSIILDIKNIHPGIYFLRSGSNEKDLVRKVMIE